ncbi:MFS transporter [Paenisporosarcina sp. TG20]|uniref:MFS transporter n=1 Tax=Paenisporosarcina sp. TG20 TaxID=1211706 RepID=UPI0002E9719D|nr:MFS transporter [Paenisporosarcina sp. TG20]
METKKAPYKSNEWEFWRIVIGLLLASFMIFGNLYIVQPLLPIFSREFQISPAYSSLAFTLTTLSLVIGLLIFGFFSDRIGRVNIMRWTLLLSILSLFFIPLVDSFEWLLVWRVFTGFMLAGLPAAAIAYINEEIDMKSRALVVSLYISSNAFGGMAGRYVGGYFAENFDWQLGFYSFASAGLVISVIVIKLLPRSNFFKFNKGTFIQDFGGMTIHLKEPLLLYAFIFGMTIQLGFSGIWTYIPFHLEKDPYNLSIQFISFLYFTYLFGVVGSLFSSRLSIKFGLIRTICTGLIIMIVGNLLTLFMHTSFIITGLSLICFGFFIAHAMASNWVGITAQHHRSGATSLYLVSYYTGASIGGTAIGFVWSSFGWLGVSLTCAILPAIAGILFLKIIVSSRESKEVRELSMKGE